MKYERRDHAPINTPIWGCAYKTNDSEKGMSLKKEPVLGMIVQEFGHKYFYELKKNGEIKKSSKVYYYSRQYADTLEESIEIYNDAVESQIKLLEELIDNCKKDKLVLT